MKEFVNCIIYIFLLLSSSAQLIVNVCGSLLLSYEGCNVKWSSIQSIHFIVCENVILSYLDVFGILHL